MTSPPDIAPSQFDDCASEEGADKAFVSLLDLAAASLSSAIVAADQITALASPDKIDKKNVRLKNDGSFVTDADLAAQQIIVDAIRKVSTDVRIVGEESEEEMNNQSITGHEERMERMFKLCQEEIWIRYHRSNEPLPLAQKSSDPTDEPVASEEVQTSPSSLTASIVSRDSFGTGIVQERMEIHDVHPNRVSVFIDPLDGTKAYAKGDYEPVSILIAVILDQTPCFGVICKPFGYPGQTAVLDTGCVVIYGGTLLGGAYTAGGSVCNIASPPKPYDASSHVEGTNAIIATSPPTTIYDGSDSPKSIDDLPRAVISSSRSQGIVQDFVSHLGDKGMINPKPLLISGAGEKSLRIILRSENEGLWFFPKAGTSLWDVAASDALLRATGGRLTDKHGNDMDYSKSRTEAENEDGVVACYDRTLHAECIRLFSEGTWHHDSSSS
jgi:3'-phosphoadenosine 5'-phosphosulfate (PAPS) 3'-phosphatase